MTSVKIGELNESSLHNELKYILESDSTYHEVKIGGYIADIFKNNTAVEIQTRQFNKLSNKILYYLRSNIDSIIAYPIKLNSTICWLNTETNDIDSKSRSTKRETKYTIFKELYKVRWQDWIHKVTYKLVELDIYDFRLLDGYGNNKKAKATKVDKKIKSVIRITDIHGIAGFLDIIPEELKDREFTSSDLSKYTRCHIDDARKMLLILSENNIIHRIGKDTSRRYIYKI